MYIYIYNFEVVIVWKLILSYTSKIQIFARSRWIFKFDSQRVGYFFGSFSALTPLFIVHTMCTLEPGAEWARTVYIVW